MVSTWSSFSGERNWKASSQNRNQPSLIISYLGDQDYSHDLANAPPTANLSSCKVRACEQGEQWQQALDLFVAEQSVKLFPDVITCNVSSVLATFVGGTSQVGFLTLLGLVLGNLVSLDERGWTPSSLVRC